MSVPLSPNAHMISRSGVSHNGTARFHDITAAIAFCRTFFPWYNTEHRHGGIAMLTPDDVHHDRTESVLDQRGRTLQAAWTRHLGLPRAEGYHSCLIRRRPPRGAPRGPEKDVQSRRRTFLGSAASSDGGRGLSAPRPASACTAA